MAKRKERKTNDYLLLAVLFAAVAVFAVPAGWHPAVAVIGFVLAIGCGAVFAVAKGVKIGRED